MPQSCGDLVGRAPVARPNENGTSRRRIGVIVFAMLGVAAVFSGSGSAKADASLDGAGYETVPSARILDTRAGSTTVDELFSGGGAIGATSTIDVKVTGRAGVPLTGVGAVVLNVTALDQSTPTYLTVFPKGAARPLASNLNPTPGLVRATLVIAKVGIDGEVSIYNNTGSVNVIADVQGWFPTSLGHAYTPVVPARLLETRPGSTTIDGLANGVGALGAGRTIELAIVGRGGVPESGVGSVALNITATNQTQPTFITAFPTGSSRPNVSSLNPSPSVVASNVVIVEVGAGGMVSIYNDSGSVDLIVDVQGWFTTGPAYTSVEPARLSDTRAHMTTVDGQENGGGPLTASSTVNVDVAGRAGVPPTGVSAVVLNVTATNQTENTFLTVFPTGGSRPGTSNSNPAPGQTAPNLVFAGVGSNGQVSIYNKAGAVDVIVDVFGWFPSDIVATDDTITLAEGAGVTGLNVLSNDIDRDGGSLTIASATQPVGGTLLMTGGAVGAFTGIAYKPDANYCNSAVGALADTFVYTLNGGFSASVAVTVNCADHTPTAHGDAMTIDEDTSATAVLVLANDTAVDGGAAIASATDPAHGTVVLTGGVPGARTGLTYQPDADYCNAPPGTTYDNFDYALTPGGSTATVTVTVTCVNDTPVLDTTIGSTTYLENDVATVIDASLTVDDIDDTNLEGATVSITSGFQLGDQLVFSNQNGISGLFTSSTGVLTISGTSSIANYRTALRSVTFSSTSDNPSTSRTVSFRASDGDADSTNAGRAIAITPVNDGPAATTTVTALAYAENQISTAIDAGLTLTDPESDSITGATISITAGFVGTDVVGFTNQAGVTGSYNSTTGVLTLSGSTTLANYQIAARSVTFRSTSENPTTARTVSFRFNDGGTPNMLSNAPARNIVITPVNDAPLNSVPGAQATDEDTALIFSNGNGNLISVSDVDAVSGALQVVVQASHGTITPTVGSGAVVTAAGTSTTTVTGTVTQVNIALNGLQYLPDPNFNDTRGTESLSLVTNDQGNTGAGGAGSDSDSISITVNAESDQPIAAAQTFGSAGTPAVQTNMAARLTGLLAGAIDPDSGDGGYTGGLFIDSVSWPASPAVGTVTIDGADSFTFAPPPGFTGSVVLTYEIFDGDELSASANATVFVSGTTIWFVDAGASAGGTGTLSSPFKTLASAVTAISADANERVFLYSGTYSTGISLNSGGWVVGQQATGADFDALMGVSPPAGTVVRPAIGTGTATVQGTVTVADAAKVRGIRISTTSATGLAGTSGTGIDVSQTSVATTTGTGLNLNNARGTYSLSSVSTNFAANGIVLNNLGSSVVTVSGGTIVGASTRGVGITAGTGDFTFNGTITTSGTTGESVDVTNHTGGTVDFNGQINDHATGIRLTNNVGSTINFDGGVSINSGIHNGLSASSSGTINFTGANTIDTTTGTALVLNATTVNLSGQGLALTASNGVGVRAAGGAVVIAGTNLSIASVGGPGFDAVSGGTVSVTGTGHTIQSVSSPALEIVSTAIGAGGVTFQSITATDSNSGVILDGTGSTAGLTVTGNGGLCTPATTTCTGGTILDSSGDGVSLTGTLSPSFALMHIQSTGGNGVVGTATTNFAFMNGFIEDSGLDEVAEAANISFADATAGTETNLSGVVTITGNALDSAYYHGIDIVDFNGTISAANISGNTITSDTTTATSKGTGIKLAALGSATTVANVTKAMIADNIVTGFPSASGIVASGGNANAAGPAGIFGVPGSGTDIIAITGNRSAGFSSANRFGANAIAATVTGRGQGNFDVSDNGTDDDPVGNSVDTAIIVSSFGFANVTATVDNNVVDAHNDAGAQGIGASTGFTYSAADTPTLTITMDSNTIDHTDGNGILAVARGATGHLNATITNNMVAAPLTGARNGIRVDAGSVTSVDDAVCLAISGNTTSGTTVNDEGIGLWKRGTTSVTNDFGIEGMTDISSPGVETHVDGQNPGSAIGTSGFGTTLLSAVSGFSNCSTAP